MVAQDARWFAAEAGEQMLLLQSDGGASAGSSRLFSRPLILGLSVLAIVGFALGSTFGPDQLASSQSVSTVSLVVEDIVDEGGGSDVEADDDEDMEDTGLEDDDDDDADSDVGSGDEVDLTCAEKDVDDCSKSRCCKDIGYQCYLKAEGWGVCKQECDKADMKKYDPKKDDWSCKAVGERARCANNSEDCSKMGCCTSANHQCYKKNDDWAMCFEGCDAAAMKKNDPKQEAWSCDAIGDRNFETQCTWAGEDCSKTKCCNNDGFTCAVKDDIFAGCTQTTKKTTWVTQQIPIPEGWKGDALGYGRSEYAIDPVGEGQPTAGTSLFCFMVYMANTTEESLMWLAKKNGVSIFGCEDHITANAWDSGSGGWDTGETTLINTDVFINAWNVVKNDGRYKKHDWTVKVDPDCVFFADRLRSHIDALRPPPYTPIYLKNNDMDPGLGNRGFLGAVEIFSTIAMQTYFANAKGCRRTLGGDSGEDGFFKGCMDSLGVGFMLDPDVFTPDFDPAVCREGGRVAFHPIKQYNQWQCCVDVVMGISRHVEYGKCFDEEIERKWIVEDVRRLQGGKPHSLLKQ